MGDLLRPHIAVDAAVPAGQSRVVNMLLFDIDSTASNTYEMLAGGLYQRMP
mgnify:CR=1 FL=1